VKIIYRRLNIATQDFRARVGSVGLCRYQGMLAAIDSVQRHVRMSNWLRHSDNCLVTHVYHWRNKQEIEVKWCCFRGEAI
jgi:hypothetical protein